MKKILLCLTGLVLACTSLTHAQTIMDAGKLEGPAGADVHIVKGISDGGSHYLIGWFRDSVDLDPGPGNYYVSGNPGDKTSFLASYNEFSELNWGFALTHPSTDSTVITDVAVDYNGNIVIAVTYTNTIDVDPLGSPGSMGTTGDFNSILLFYDPANGTFVDVIAPGSTGGSGCMITSIGINGTDIIIGGWFIGSVDMDNSAGISYITAGSMRESFVATYTVLGYSYINSRAFYGVPGNEAVTAVTYYDGYYYATGTFDQNIELDAPSSAVFVSTNVGTTDIFYIKLDNALSTVDGLAFGGNGDDRSIGLYRNIVLFEFGGTIDINPLGSPIPMTSLGLTDVGAADFSSSGFTCNWHKQWGNALNNKAHFLYEKASQIYVGMDFEGTINVKGEGAAGGSVLATATNNPVNGLVIEIDGYGNYIDHYQVEAQHIGAILPSGNNPNDIFMAGDFSGSNVDVMPYDSVIQLSTTTNRAGFIAVFNRCRATVNAVQQGLYTCGACDAAVKAWPFGAAGSASGVGISYYWYPGFSPTQTVENLCPGTYTVTMSDMHGCTALDSVKIMEHAPSAIPTTDVTVTHSSCGNNYGSATATVLGAVGTVNYYWSNGDSTSVADSLTAGFYNMYVYDDIMCKVLQTFNVLDVDGPTVSLVGATNLSCSGVNSGAIDISVTGGATPYNFLWSNGASTEDLSGITAGTYAVIVTDANGCQGQLCVDVTTPDPLTVSLVGTNNTSACGLSDGSIEVTGTGGTAPYTYSWDAAAGSQTTALATGLAAGYYNVTVQDASGCVSNLSFGVSETGGPYVGYLGSNNVSCTWGPGFIMTNIPDGTVTSQWNTGDPGPHLFNIETSGKYFLTATDPGGCKTVFEYELGQYLPAIPEICMVTVDETNTKNVVVWDKTLTPDADHYNIYREGFCNTYEFTRIGTVDHDSLSVFEDTVVNTATRSWRYYIKAVDSCGYESYHSEINRTIHLTALANFSGEALLNWEAYVGREVYQYDIYRIDAVDPNLFTKIDSVDGSILNYTDDDDFSAYINHDLEWYVEAVPVEPCYATRAFNQNASRSNHTRLGLGVILDTTGTHELPAIDELIQLYPNPANDLLNIRVKGSDMQYHVTILNNIGQQVSTYDFKRSVSISTAGMNQGIYYVMISNQQKQNKVYKLVIAH